MIFITGGSGLIGSFVIQKLLSEGYKIRALTRKKKLSSLAQDAHLEWVIGDLFDIPKLEDYMDGVEYVVHCAALVSFVGKERAEMYRTNVTGTRNLINVALHHSIKKFCHISSVAALGRPKNTDIIHENILWEDSDQNTHYSKSKYLAEVEVWRGQAEGLNTFILNPSVVLGPGDWEASSTQLFRYVWREKSYYTQGIINAVDVRDVAEALYQGLHSALSNERFILNSDSMEYKKFFELIAKGFDKKAPSRLVKPWMAAIAWRAAYVLSLITGKAPLISRETASMAQKSFQYDNQKAVTKLNIKFRTLPESIEWTCTELIKKYSLTKV